MKGDWDHDRDPLAALQRGETAPFEAFVRAARAGFAGFFRRRGAPAAEAEDLVQEVFLKMYRNAPKYAAQERFTAYAFRVARNAWIDRQRRRGAAPDNVSLDSGSSDDSFGIEATLGDRLESHATAIHDQVSDAEEAQRLRDELARLPEHHRLVFELGVLQELPYAEIADLLGIRVGTVKSRMFYAVRKLRAAVEPAAVEDEAVAAEAAPNTEAEKLKDLGGQA